MKRVILRRREFLIAFAVLCCVLLSCMVWFQRRKPFITCTSTITRPNRSPSDLLFRLYSPLQDFTIFPCLETLTPSAGLKRNGGCVRTVNFPKQVLQDQKGCVPLKFGRGTPICTHPVDEDIHVSRALIQRGMWEEDLVGQMLNILNRTPSMMLLDLGCNIGVYTISAALHSNKVVCVDPNFENLYLVSKSLTHGNLLENVTLIWNAISEEQKNAVLRKQFRNVGGAEIDSKNKTLTGFDISVNTIRLDDLKELFVSQEVYMKLDVQGFEHEVLKSGRDVFKTANVRYVQMEFVVHRGLLTGTLIIDTLFEYGYLPYTDCTGITLLKPAYHSEWPYDVCFIRK